MYVAIQCVCRCGCSNHFWTGIVLETCSCCVFVFVFMCEIEGGYVCHDLCLCCVVCNQGQLALFEERVADLCVCVCVCVCLYVCERERGCVRRNRCLSVCLRHSELVKTDDIHRQTDIAYLFLCPLNLLRHSELVKTVEEGIRVASKVYISAPLRVCACMCVWVCVFCLPRCVCFAYLIHMCVCVCMC